MSAACGAGKAAGEKQPRAWLQGRLLPSLALPHLAWELGEEGDVHLLALGGQTFKEGLVGALGVIHGRLVALQE